MADFWFSPSGKCNVFAERGEKHRLLNPVSDAWKARIRRDRLRAFACKRQGGRRRHNGQLAKLGRHR